MLNLDKVFELCTAKGVSQSHLARQIGVPENRVVYFFRDKKKSKNLEKAFTDEQIQIIAECLNTTPEYLTDKTEIKEKPIPTTENELFAKISLLPSDLQKRFLHFLELAAANPDTAMRFLDFAVVELEIASRSD